MPFITSLSTASASVVTDHVMNTASSAVAMATSDLFHIATINPTSVLSIPTAATSLAITIATTAAAAAPFDDPEESSGDCELLGSFAIFVQGALGGLALLSLVYKRWRERPQRPVKIWAFDASKQVVGSILLHLANLVMSMFSSGKFDNMISMTKPKYQPNPCSFYLLNLGIDTTLGIPILIGLLRLLHAAFLLTPMANPPESIQSGNYGSPPRYTWWLKQSVIYFCGLLGMKLCVFIIFQLMPWLVRVGDWALRWTEGNTAIQITFVMFIFPLIMNAMQYYIIDIFIKKKVAHGEDEAGPQSGADGDEHGGLLEDQDDIDSSIDVDEEDEARKKNPNVTTYKSGARSGSSTQPHGHAEYIPERDGDTTAQQARESTTDEELLTKIPKPTE